MHASNGCLSRVYGFVQMSYPTYFSGFTILYLPFHEPAFHRREICIGFDIIQQDERGRGRGLQTANAHQRLKARVAPSTHRH